MSEYDNELKGVLFKNKDKRPDKKDADYRGNATIDGVEFWVDSWVNEAKSGEKYMSLKFKPKEQQRQAPAAKAPAPESPFDDDLPF
jgi:hypothetical protein